MNDLEMCTAKFVIASGMVAGGAKQFQGRLCDPGICWSRPGAEQLMPVCIAILSGRFANRWDQVYNSPPS